MCLLMSHDIPRSSGYGSRICTKFKVLLWKMVRIQADTGKWGNVASRSYNFNVFNSHHQFALNPEVVWAFDQRMQVRIMKNMKCNYCNLTRQIHANPMSHEYGTCIGWCLESRRIIFGSSNCAISSSYMHLLYNTHHPFLFRSFKAPQLLAMFLWALQSAAAVWTWFLHPFNILQVYKFW